MTFVYLCTVPRNAPSNQIIIIIIIINIIIIMYGDVRGPVVVEMQHNTHKRMNDNRSGGKSIKR